RERRWGGHPDRVTAPTALMRLPRTAGHRATSHDWSAVAHDAPDGEGYLPLAASFSFEPADTFTEYPAGIWIGSPVCGLRAVRAARCVRSKVRKPGTVTFSSPLETTSPTTSANAASTASASLRVTSARSASAATSSLRFMFLLPCSSCR